MSYIINSSSPFINVKLTDIGRDLLSKGQLTFNHWAIGDSEINYDRELVSESNPLDGKLNVMSKILSPKDSQPNLKYYIKNSNDSSFNLLNSGNVNSIKLTVDNKALERGFFSGNPITGFTILDSFKYVKLKNSFLTTNLNGSKILNFGVTGTSVGDLLMIKVGDDSLLNSKPIPILWFKVQSITGTNLTLDRNLPNLTFSGNSLGLIYKGGEVYNGFGENNTTAYWDSGTLSFDSSCDITREDVPIWNMNNVFSETMLGVTGNTYEDYTRYGSYSYLGQMLDYLGYGNHSINNTQISDCGVSNWSIDSFNKSISIIHYTNNTISNLYGEFLHIDNSSNKTVKLHLPNLMYHRRGFNGGTSSGDTIGMSFIASGETKTILNSNITYVDLIEDPLLLINTTPKVVGKVLPELKLIIIDDAEIIATMSYKSNRNWTLPELSINLVPPSGNTVGVLNTNESVYVTYSLDGGLTSPLPCQTFSKITNVSNFSKDIDFKINSVDLLPYMMKNVSEVGFHAYEFKLIYQIVSGESRPNPNDWRVVDFTSTNIVGNLGEAINPKLLENQNPYYNFQILNLVKDSTSSQYDITQVLSTTPILVPDILQFGDEKFFYGNVESYIGATIYKTIFDIRINSGQYNTTTNPTRDNNPSTNPPHIRVSEIGIYDSNYQLVIVGKLSSPIKLVSGQTIMIEMSLDF